MFSADNLLDIDAMIVSLSLVCIIKFLEFGGNIK